MHRLHYGRSSDATFLPSLPKKRKEKALPFARDAAFDTAFAAASTTPRRHHRESLMPFVPALIGRGRMSPFETPAKGSFGALRAPLDSRASKPQGSAYDDMDAGSPMTHEALQTLGAVATEDLIGAAAARRMSEVIDAVGPDLAEVELLLAESSQTGASPGTSAAAHLLGAGGKRIRPVALLLASSMYTRSSRATHELAAVAELVHGATLLHDDVIDDASERRGQAAARTVWGNAVSVLGGDLMLTHALSRCHAVGHQAIFAHLLQTLRTLVDGEIVQLRGRTALDLRAETYFHIANAKTASLFDWATTSGARIAGAPEEHALALGRFGVHLGLAFQLVDDVIDYAGTSEFTGKALFADLREGKVTLPLVYALERDPSVAAHVEAIRAGDELAALRLGPAIVATDGCDRVRTLAESHTKSALAELAALPQSPSRDLLAAVASDLVARLH